MVDPLQTRPERRSSGFGIMSAALLVVIAILLAMLLVQSGHQREGSPLGAFTTPYQAVLLSNGLAYFGKVESRDARFLVLTDVYYVQTRSTPGAQGQQTQSNVLVKRGTEWHAPDRMAINVDHIVFTEPVSTGSQLEKLIAQQKSK
jgi:hypothetical protein